MRSVINTKHTPECMDSHSAVCPDWTELTVLVQVCPKGLYTVFVQIFKMKHKTTELPTGELLLSLL